MKLYCFALASFITSVLCQMPPGQPNISGPQVIILGNSVTLSCSSTGGTPTPTVNWLRDNNVITSGVSTSTSGSVTTTTYTFTASRDEHYEVFECQADNNVLQNPLSTTKFVEVNFAPQIPPVISGPPTLTQGDQGTWTCVSADGYPAPTMTMRIANTGITNGFTSNAAFDAGSSSFTVTGTLVWNPTTANSGQQLCCDVVHSTSSTPQSDCLTLTVNSPLAINAPVLQYNPTIGNNVVLQCDITAGTATGVSWTKDGSSLNIFGRLSGGTVSTPSLTITGVVQSDAGNYVCQATDGTANVNTNTINVNPQGTPPVVTLPVTSYSQVTGNSVTLQCTVASPNSPLQNVQWTFTNQAGVTTDPINVSGTTKYSGSLTTSPSLVINGVQSTDQGTYRCRATNLIGQTLSPQTATLTVTGSLPVVQVPNPTYSVVYGTQVQLVCNIVSASPSVTNVYWTKILSNGGTTTINTGASGTQGITPGTPSMTINFPTSSDAGTYRCHATNAVGTGQSSTTLLTVTGGLLTINISPATDTVIQGTTKVVTCTLNGQPSATSVSWTKDFNNLNIANSGGKYSGGTTSLPSLTINNFQSSDAGTYRCSATNSAGTSNSGTSVLSFLGLLSVSVSPSSNTVNLGTQSVTIQCSVSGTTQATSWEWTKTPIGGGNTEVISQGTNNGDRQVVNSATNPNLILTGITQSDEGVYRCRANNGAGLVTSNPSTLNVQGAIPTVSVEPSQYTGTIGDASYQIQCTVTAVPSATSWYWTFTPSAGGTSTTIQQGTNNQNYMMDNSASKPHLTIKNLAASDAGDYRCFAINQVGTGQSSNSRLIVVGGILSVDISPAAANVVRGNTQVITCTIAGTPSVQSVTWYKNNAVLNPNSNTAKYSGGTAQVPSLTISNFQSSDGGTYYCAATNAAGIGTSLPDTSVLTYVEFLSLSATPNSGSANIGDSQYIISCTITGTPQATSYYWTKNPTDGTASSTINQGTNNAKYTIAQSSTNPSLTIKNIVQSDDANYVCTATNAAGTRSSNSARLLVTGAIPQISATPILQSPTFGASSVSIQCSVSGSPSAQNVGWRKISLNGQSTETINAPNSNGKYSVVNSLTAPHLTISNLNFDDDANYQCTATNAVGTGVSNLARVDVVGSKYYTALASEHQ